MSSSRSEDEKVTGRHELDDDVESVGKFTVWFSDFTRFDETLHLLIDLNVFTDGDEQLLLLLKVNFQIIAALLLFNCASQVNKVIDEIIVECF